MTKFLAFFSKVDRSVGGHEWLIAVQDRLPDNEARYKFTAEYTVISRIWEARSPDPCPGPYEVDYKWPTPGVGIRQTRKRSR